MLGLMVLLALGVYFAISALVVWLAVRIARKLNRRAWLWGGMAAFVMYNLVFWDWIPTLVMHRYYCATEAGFWVYKTPEQWDRENPGVLGRLRPYSKVKWNAMVIDGGRVDQYNDRFGYWSKSVRNGLFIGRRETGIVDVNSGELIVVYVDFISGPRGFGVIWKGWLNRNCETPSNTVSVQQVAMQLNMGAL